MRDMKAGDKAFFYHSNCKKPGIVGIVEVSCAVLFGAVFCLNSYYHILHGWIKGFNSAIYAIKCQHR